MSEFWVLSSGVVNDIPNSMLCLTSFLVLHSTTCGYVCVHKQVGQSNTMKEYIRTLISPNCFPEQKYYFNSFNAHMLNDFITNSL